MSNPQVTSESLSTQSIRSMRLIKAMTAIGQEINSIEYRARPKVEPPESLKIRIKTLIERASLNLEYESSKSIPEAYRSLEYLQNSFAVLKDNPSAALSFNQAKLSIVINAAINRIIDATLKKDYDLDLILSEEIYKVIDEIIRFVRLRWPHCKTLGK